MPLEYRTSLKYCHNIDYHCRYGRIAQKNSVFRDNQKRAVLKRAEHAGGATESVVKRALPVRGGANKEESGSHAKHVDSRVLRLLAPHVRQTTV